MHFQLLARPVDDTPVVLLTGQPQEAALDAGAWGYYTLARLGFANPSPNPNPEP